MSAYRPLGPNSISVTPKTWHLLKAESDRTGKSMTRIIDELFSIGAIAMTESQRQEILHAIRDACARLAEGHAVALEAGDIDLADQLRKSCVEITKALGFASVRWEASAS